MATRAEFWFSGLPVSPGIATGTVFRSDSGILPVPERSLEPQEIEEECRRLADATEKSIRQIRKLKSKTGGLEGAAAEELGFLLDARLQMLSGSRLVRGSEKRIRDQKINAEAAVRDEIAIITEAFAKMSDRYLAARGADVSEVGERLIRNLLRQPFHSLKDTPNGCVIVAEELTPADAALLDPDRVVAFMTALGGVESHTAIIARSLGIPAVLGIAGLLNAVRDGETVIVDGNAGRVVVNPSDETVADYARRIVALSEERRGLLRLRKVPSITRDGTEIALECNLEMPRDVPAALINGAAGIGLLRTEFMFMNRDTVPSEEEQYSLLRQAVEGMNGRPVTIRTLDIGGDKLAPSLREQLGEAVADGANPALGLRGIRLSLEHPRLFEGQLAAILRAAAYGPVRILLPMITSTSEIERVRGVLDRVMRRLRRRKDPVSADMPPLGAMIEVPGAALAADGLSMAADFFAIGTNDLTMYTLAIDRGDDRVAPLYNPLHPSVLRLIQFTLEAGMRSRIPVSICGEIAGDPRYTALLLGLGVRDLSMAAAKIPRVKQRILQLDLATATKRARMVMDQSNETRIKELVEEFNLSLALAGES